MAEISIAEQAANWFARLSSQDASQRSSAAELAAFERWRADEACAAAYAELERLAALLDESADSSVRLRALAAQALQLDSPRGGGADGLDRGGDCTVGDCTGGDCPAVKAGGS